MESTRPINRPWQKSRRAVLVAALSSIAVFSIGCVYVADFRSHAFEETQDIAVIAAEQSRLVREWLYLSLASFVATLVCSIGFEYAHFKGNRWLSGIFVFVTPFILLFAGVVAYFPYNDVFEQGWWINLGIVPRLPLLTGTASLIVGMILRQRSRRHGLP